jgi:hypothetical protein
MSDELDALVKTLVPEASEFFVYFARFEYALKTLGGKYLKGREGEGAEANWDNFATRLGSSFWERVKGNSEFQYFLDHPVKKQVVNKDGRLGWKCVPVSCIHDLIHAIGRVRNNLFHGGKYPPDVSRDRDLLKQGRMILELALAECPELRKIFCDLG